MKMFLLIIIFFFAPIKNNISNLKNPINSGIDFLYKSQLETGEFKTYICKNKDMINCSFDSSPFATSCILYSIKNYKNNKIKIIYQKGNKFFTQRRRTWWYLEILDKKITKKYFSRFRWYFNYFIYLKKKFNTIWKQ